MRFNFKSISIALALALAPASGFAASCGGDYGSWLQGVRQEASGRGVGARGLAALDGLTTDPSVLSRDRGQKVFRQSFEQFSGRMVPPRLNPAANKLRAQGSLFNRIEDQYGVPGPVLVAIWGLETDFGAFQGSFNTLRALATLAHDCRRSDRFRSELIDGLKIVDAGYMTPASMRGAWAGEIGQTQFMPSSYLKYGAGRDLIHNSGDALAATANYLRGYGWQKGAGWEPGQPNFAVIKEWNKSDVYARTIAYFATRVNQMVH